MENRFSNFERQFRVEKTGFSDEQGKTLRMAMVFGKEIQSRFPEVAESYKQGKTLRDIVLQYGIQEILGITNFGLAMSSVRNAIVGTKEYEGLIADKDLLASIEKSSKQASGARRGEANKAGRIGIFAQTREQLQKTGRQNALKTLREGTGIHALTSEERKATGKMSSEARGFVPFSQEEIDLIDRLSTLPEYRLPNKILNSAKIAEEVNKQIHEGHAIRNRKSIARFVAKERKRIQKANSPTTPEGAD